MAYWPKLGYTGHSRKNTNYEIIQEALDRCQTTWDTDQMCEKVVRDHISLVESERRIAGSKAASS